MSTFYNTIARYYDAENLSFTEDIPLYLEWAEQTGEPILEVGCGAGRVMFSLAQAGYQVIGVDTSAEMLSIARQKLARMPQLGDHLRIVQADIVQFNEGHFPLILLTYNVLMHFTELESQLALLKHLAGLLTEDGRLVIDLPNVADTFASEDDGSLRFERSFVEPISGNLVMQQSVSSLNRAEQLLHVTWIYDEIGADGGLKRILAPQVLRCVLPAELHLMLKLANLEMLARYGSYEQDEFEDGSDRLVVVAKRV